MHGPTHRRAATAIEAAVVLPVLFLLVFGIIIGGMRVYRYQQVAFLAREGSRWASVRGGEYEKELDRDPPTSQEIIEQAIRPMAIGIDPALLEVRVEWVDHGTNTVWEWDSAPKDVRSISPTGEYVTNTVRVTVRYRCAPGFVTGPLTVVSVSEIPMAS